MTGLAPVVGGWSVLVQEQDRRDGVQHAVARHDMVREGVGRPQGIAPKGKLRFLWVGLR